MRWKHRDGGVPDGHAGGYGLGVSAPAEIFFYGTCLPRGNLLVVRGGRPDTGRGQNMSVAVHSRQGIDHPTDGFFQLAQDIHAQANFKTG